MYSMNDMCTSMEASIIIVEACCHCLGSTLIFFLKGTELNRCKSTRTSRTTDDNKYNLLATPMHYYVLVRSTLRDL